MRPFIGVTCSSDPAGQPLVNAHYVRALLLAGALPVPLPYVRTEAEAREVLARLDGLVFSGSEDLDPALWGEPRHPRTELMHPARMSSEMLYAREALAARAPALGICGGMQTLNVACGGSLHQHVPDVTAGGQPAIEHADASYVARHPVELAPGSRLARLLGAELAVNSHHHQAVARLGAGLAAVARAPDGIVEAFEAPGRPFLLGVQWHPERMAGEAGSPRLFEALVEAARSRRVAGAGSAG
jgi:gamma-glutamyl-gamma-aminobutyrate hydrolase PuuD